MAYEIFPDLINQLQILLRKESGLESFNPNDPSIPSLPTISQAISELDPTSFDGLRCAHCSGMLLLGADSVICIYCRRAMAGEGPRGGVWFGSTVGYRWLIESLGFDGSEIVKQPIDGTTFSRRQSSQKDEISLSDFLNLEMEWPDESERLGITDETELSGKSSLSLVGVNVDDLFPESIRESVYSISGEQFTGSDKIENQESKAFRGDASLSLFESAKSSEVVLKSDDGKDDESLSGWEAEFQSASSDSQLKDLKPSDASTNHEALDYSSHMDSVFMPDKDKHEKSTNVLDTCDGGNILKRDNSSSLDCSQENQMKTSSGQLRCNEESIGDDTFDEWNTFTNANGEQNTIGNSVFVPESKNSVSKGDLSDALLPNNDGEGADDDSLDTWNDFTSSTTTPNDSLQTKSVQVHQESKDIPVDYSFDGLDDFTKLGGPLQIKQKYVGTKIVETQTPDLDDPNGMWSSYSTSAKPGSKETSTELDDSFDVWDNFKSSITEHDNQRSNNSTKMNDDKVVNEGKNSVDMWGDFMGLTFANAHQQQKNTEKVSENKGVTQDNCPFDTWSDFRSSAMAGDSRLSSSTMAQASSNQTDSMEAITNMTINKDNNLLDSWGDFGSSFRMPVNQPKTVGAKSSDDTFFDGWSDNVVKSSTPDIVLQSSGLVEANNKKDGQNDDSFDAWSDFTSSSNAQSELQHSSTTREPDDPFDAWNVFASSTTAEKGDPTLAPKDPPSELNFLSSTSNLQDVEPLQEDIFTGSLSNQNGSTPVDNVPSAPVSMRMNDSAVEQTQKREGIANGALDSESNNYTEKLMSEMHDLSFMLESDLSVPRR